MSLRTESGSSDRTLSDRDWYAGCRRFDWRGHSIAYRLEAADKPSLLCIHGFPTHSWDWCKVWPALQSHYQLIAPDLLGYGHSSKPKAHRYSLLEQADLIEDLLRHLSITQTHVLAHDYGDSVAQELLARHEAGNTAAQWQSITLLNGGLFPEAHRPRRIQTLLAGPLGPLLVRFLDQKKFSSSFAEVFGPDTAPDANELDAMWRLIAKDDGHRLAHRLLQYIPERRRHAQSWRETMQRTRVPLLLINGNADPVSGLHLSQRYRELIPNPKVIDLPRIGHYPQWEAPQAVVEAVLGFARLD